MLDIWTRGLPEDKKAAHIEALKNSSVLKESLAKILDKRETELLRRDNTLTQFDEPNWQFKEAYIKGQRQTLSFIRDLLNF
jgi:hypothetical protein